MPHLFEVNMSITTIRDIAREAGVGKSTVSRVINGSGYVSVETRKKIEEVMKRNNYVPSSAARSLSKKESDTIGLIIPEVTNPFFGEILNGISQRVDENDLTLILCNSANDDIEKDFRAFEGMLRHRVKGLIFTPATSYSKKQLCRLCNYLDKLQCPLVLLDRSIANLNIDGVFTDNFQSAYMATEALIKAGHRKIGTVTGDQNLSIGCDRQAGFEKALETYGIELNEKYIVQGNFDTETTYICMQELIQTGDLPTAFFISNNLSCAGFLKAVIKHRLRIPEDIAIIVFDKIIGQDIFDLKYSFVERDVQNMGRLAMQLLLSRLKEPNRNVEKIVIKSTLNLLGSEKFVSN